MKYLMDTCAFIWYVEESSILPARLRAFIDRSSTIYLSQASLWEIAIKKTTGKLDLAMNTFELEAKCAENKITLMPLKSEYFERIQKLPLIHKDPFDRIIMATALEEGHTILTCDSEIVKYPDVKTLWQIN